LFNLVYLTAFVKNSYFSMAKDLGRVEGLSAYEIWLSAGHSGSENDFLEWLKGQTGSTPDITVTAHGLPYGDNPTSDVMGTPENPNIDFGIPEGKPGTNGKSVICKGELSEILRKIYPSSGTDQRGIQWPKAGQPAIGRNSGTGIDKKSATKGDVEWKYPGTSLPSGGTAKQALVKQSSAEGDAGWKNVGYNDLINEPAIDGTTLTENTSSSALGLAHQVNYPAIPVTDGHLTVKPPYKFHFNTDAQTDFFLKVQRVAQLERAYMGQPLFFGDTGRRAAAGSGTVDRTRSGGGGGGISAGWREFRG
jgi:hypothetical protein